MLIHGKQDQGNAAEEEMLEKEGPDSPLLDLSDVAVKELIRGRQEARLCHPQPDQRVGILRGGQVRADRGHPGSINFRDPSHRVGQDHTLKASQIDKG